MRRLALAVIVALMTTPMLSGCLTATFALVAASQNNEARHAREDYHHPGTDPFAQNGVYSFDGSFGAARLTVLDGRATVELSGCATFSGVLTEGSSSQAYGRYLWNLDQPNPPWLRLSALTPEDMRILDPACAGLRDADRIQMTTGFKGEGWGGYGTVLFIQGLTPRPPEVQSFDGGRRQVFARPFGAP